MSVQKKNCNTKPKQFEILVEFMVQHPDLAKGHINSPEAKSKSRHLWERLTLQLNSACLPTRDSNGWKKVWADYKNHIKVKCKRNKMGISRTGGGPSNYCALTLLEEQVYELLSLNTSIHGISGGKEFGAAPLNKEPTTSSINIAEEDLENNFEIRNQSILHPQKQNNENLNINTPRRSIRKSSALNTDSLLSKQVENQISFQENSLKCLIKIDGNQKNHMKLLKSLKDNIFDMKRYSKRKCEIEERSLELQIQKFEFKKKIELEKNKRKLAQLELKQKMFQLECEKYATRSTTTSKENCKK